MYRIIKLYKNSNAPATLSKELLGTEKEAKEGAERIMLGETDVLACIVCEDVARVEREMAFKWSKA